VIPHDAALDAALGAVAWEPVSSLVFLAPDGSPVTVNGVVEGRITHTSLSWPRVECNLVLPTAVTPASTAPPVSPWGGQLLVYAGARVGTKAYTSLCHTLDVAETRVSRPDGTITVRCVSREARVNEDRYDTREATPAGTVSSVVAGILRRTLGAGLVVQSTLTSDPTLAAGAFPLDGDVWPVVERLMDAAGGECVFLYDGSALLRDVPTKGSAVATLAVGERGTLTGYDSTRRWAHNRVAVVYDDGSARRVGVWQVTNAASPVRATGPYGRHTRVDRVTVDAGKLPTQAQADAAAAAIGRRALAPFRSTAVQAVPAPWLEPGDTVALDFLGGLAETHLLTSNAWNLSQLEPADILTADDAYTGSVFHA
jgi:hypothetical protein